MRRKWHGWLLMWAAMGMVAALSAAQAQPGSDDQAPAANDAAPPDPTELIRALRDRIEEDEAAMEPARAETAEQAPAASAPLGVRLNIDPSVVGVAPGQDQPTLRREGEFVVRRLGRMVRTPDGAQAIFVFESDDRETPEAPLILLPCKVLEDMENAAREMGDRVVFQLSGQITQYRGRNFVLPTTAIAKPDRGNLP